MFVDIIVNKKPNIDETKYNVIKAKKYYIIRLEYDKFKKERKELYNQLRFLNPHLRLLEFEKGGSLNYPPEKSYAVAKCVSGLSGKPLYPTRIYYNKINSKHAKFYSRKDMAVCHVIRRGNIAKIFITEYRIINKNFDVNARKILIFFNHKINKRLRLGNYERYKELVDITLRKSMEFACSEVFYVRN